jgi:RimJ/RimL family protein N-acetyltransferase
MNNLKLKIRRHLSKDIPYRVKWLNNPAVNQFIGDQIGQKTTLQKEKAWFASYLNNPQKRFFTICDQDQPIGFMGFSNISRHNRNADLFIAIGEDEYRGKGIGKTALKWLIDYEFQKLQLHKISLGLIKDNIPALKLYTALGFELEGEMKDEIWHEGRYYNTLSMALFNNK